MRRALGNYVACALVVLLASGAGLASALSPPKEGDKLPKMEIPVPEDPALRAYLGLSGGALFQVPQIKARVVIIEVFSMYCPHCQREAPSVNRLYELIEGRRDLKGKIKLIGVGAGNSAFEVEVFGETYDIPFPLFPDEDFSLHEALGEVKTPHFIGVSLSKGTHEVFYSKTGGFQDPEEFLKQILQQSGLEKGGT